MSGGKWEVDSKTATTESVVLNASTLGFYPVEYKYEVTNTETGETKEVTAFSESHLGKKISAGEFKK